MSALKSVFGLTGSVPNIVQSAQAIQGKQFTTITLPAICFMLTLFYYIRFYRLYGKIQIVLLSKYRIALQPEAPVIADVVKV